MFSNIEKKISFFRRDLLVWFNFWNLVLGRGHLKNSPKSGKFEIFNLNLENQNLNLTYPGILLLLNVVVVDTLRFRKARGECQ